MAGEYIKTKASDRIWYVNLGTSTTKKWCKISRGIASRGTSISEKKTDYYDMEGRGVAESEVESVTIGRTFSGFRVLGDPAQDEILLGCLYDLNRREVEYMEFYDNMPTGVPNGHTGKAYITISDDGSGDANTRENIAFGLNLLGMPEAGTVTLSTDGVPTFVKYTKPPITK